MITVITTILSLTAFAFNSILCRLALGAGHVDASSFTAIRLVSGIITLFILLGFSGRSKVPGPRGNWFSSSMLFVYASAFSFAYLTLDTGTGALILFTSVQVTMILNAMVKGERLHYREWLGLALAFGGFVYLVLPGITTPSGMGFLLMTLAGIGWGFYTLAGKSAMNPLTATGFNFLRTLPLMTLLFLFTLKKVHLNPQGILLAILSGALASGIGYALWYKALKGLSTVQSAVLQLVVPVIAALGGWVMVSEPLTPRLAVSGMVILGGIYIVAVGKR